MSSEDLKKMLLDMLEEDKEFRYAIAGAIGYKEILDRIAKVEEEMSKRFLEMEERINARFLKLEERIAKVEEEMSKRFLEMEERINARFLKLEERIAKVEEEMRDLREESNKLRQDMLEGFRSHDRLIQELRISIGSLGRRMGRDMEKMVLNIYRDNLIQLGIDKDKALRFEYIDREGLYGLKGRHYEFDVVVSNSHIDIMEVKSHAEEEDIVVFYEKVNSIKQVIEHTYRASVRRLVVVTVHIDKEAVDKANELGVECVYGDIISE